MKEVLAKMRELNRLLQIEEWSQELVSTEGEIANLPLNSLAVALGNILDANTYLIDQEGVLLGEQEQHKVNTPRVRNFVEMKQFPDYYTNSVNQINRTIANVDIENPNTIFPEEKKDLFPDGYTTIIPIYASKQRLGTLILGRIGTIFKDEDLVLAEHAATIVGIEMVYSSNRKTEEENRRKRNAEMTLQTLSYSEVKAVTAIFEKLNGNEQGILTATNIADEIEITRSVVVNAIRKLESGGIIQSKSLGMKGTFIKILNTEFLSLLQSVQK